MKFVFLNYYAFLFFIPLFVFLFIFYKAKKGSKEFSAFLDLKKVYSWDSLYYRLYYFFIFLFFSSIILFIANPSLEVKKQKVDKQGVDIEIVLDVSYSMIAEDLIPNRLEVAKSIIKEFLDNLDYARVGMIVFAGRPFEFFSLNSDFSSLKKNISFLDTSIINQNMPILNWTALWDAMVLASDNFDYKSEKWNIIILITDWEANRWENLRLMLKYIISKNIKVYTIWIWWDKKTYINLFDEFFSFREVWPLDEETLKKISIETGWKYFRAKNKNDLRKVFEEISKEERKMINFIDYISLRFIPLILALIFLILILILRVKKFKNN